MQTEVTLSHDHSHHDEHGMHGHSHGANASAGQLKIALAITTAFLLTEIAGGLIFKSLALLSDAAHMFTDTAGLAIALVAIRLGHMPADDQRTFGYRRFEILAASFNAVLLFGVGAYVLYEGIRRLITPEPVQSNGMLVIAVIGLVANFVSMRILASGKDKSLNVKGAYMEVWADMLGSLGVIVGAIVIRLTAWNWVDPVVAVGIGLWVLPRTWSLLKDTTNILIEGTPRGVVLADIRAAIQSTPGVTGTHDLHVWISGADVPSCSVHVAISSGEDTEAIRNAIARRLADDFGLNHVTIQTETTPCEPDATLHT